MVCVGLAIGFARFALFSPVVGDHWYTTPASGSVLPSNMDCPWQIVVSFAVLTMGSAETVTVKLSKEVRGQTPLVVCK